MGSRPSVELTPDCDSAFEPGTKVVASEALAVDYDALLDEMLEQMRYPVDSYKEYVLKSCDVEEHGKDDFTVKVILDGKKLKSYGYGKEDGSETDRIDIWTRVTANRAGKFATSKPIVAPPGCWVDEVDEVKAKPTGGAKYMFVQEEDKVKVEFIVDMADGSKLDGEQSKGVLAPTIGGAMAALSKQKVKVKADQDSIKSSGLKSVISESMEEHTTFDAFWDRFMEILKAPPGAPSNLEVVEVSDSEFHTVVKDPATDSKWITKIRHCKESGEVQTVTMNDGGILSKAVVILHKDPLRCESWGEDKDGVRQSGRGAAKGLQEYIDTVLAEKKSGWFW